MRMFGLDAGIVSTLLARVAPPVSGGVRADDPEPAALEDRFARGAFSTLVEPGDGDAGALVAALGAASALTAIIEKRPPERIADAVAEVDPIVAEQLRPALADALARWQPRLASASTVHAFELAARVGARLLVPTDALWPMGLDDLGPHAPLVLWLRGTAEACTSLANSIALVGARAATGYGEHVAAEASAGLVDRGLAIVSGAAYGIDGMAHRAALASHGQTIAFLAGGVDRFYPSGHDALLSRIVEEGAILSELPCSAAPTKWRFLQRNRLIAAASQATVVLEAGWRSGSLNTAGHAAALGRPLGAVPGPVTSPASAGCHRLIRDYDAICVTGAAEMAELVAGLDASVDQPHGTEGTAESSGLRSAQGRSASAQGRLAQGRSAQGRSAQELRVLDALSTRSARSIDDIARRTGLATSTVGSVLGLLQLEGVAREREGGWIASRAPE